MPGGGGRSCSSSASPCAGRSPASPSPTRRCCSAATAWPTPPPRTGCAARSPSTSSASSPSSPGSGVEVFDREPRDLQTELHRIEAGLASHVSQLDPLAGVPRNGLANLLRRHQLVENFRLPLVLNHPGFDGDQIP